jgi:hypothetical protein
MNKGPLKQLKVNANPKEAGKRDYAEASRPGGVNSKG